MKNLLSVIIPIHNKALTIRRVLDSISEQTLSADQLEIIFVADHCTDESLAMLQSTRTRYREKIIELSDGQGSAARARNCGLELAEGDFCLFMDSDIVIPSDFLSSLSNRLRSSDGVVYLAPVYGSSSSLSIWPFEVQDHSVWTTMSNEGLLNWAATQHRLKDLRVQFADHVDGSLDHLPAPWVFCWSTAVALARKLLDLTGGFNASLSHKGSEDLELGYRLHNAGARFRLMRDTYVFHLPQDRNRDIEERTDRLHEREMLRLHPVREMEALCAFDGSHANPILELLEWIRSDITNDLERSWDLPLDRSKLSLPSKVPLILGPPAAWLVDNLDFDYIVWPSAQPGILPLFGFSLPFDDGSFSAAALIGLWQLLPERLACRIIDEALRVATEVYLLKDMRSALPVPPWSLEILSFHDSPYWERTHKLRRSFYDFTLYPCGEDGTICSFRVYHS